MGRPLVERVALRGQVCHPIVDASHAGEGFTIASTTFGWGEPQHRRLVTAVRLMGRADCTPSTVPFVVIFGTRKRCLCNQRLECTVFLYRVLDVETGTQCSSAMRVCPQPIRTSIGSSQCSKPRVARGSSKRSCRAGRA